MFVFFFVFAIAFFYTRFHYVDILNLCNVTIDKDFLKDENIQVKDIKISSDGKLLLNGREIIKTEDSEKILSSLYDDDGHKGRDKLFQIVYDKYYGISRRSIMSFIKSKQK